MAEAKERIQIKGAPPKYDEAEFQRRFDMEVHRYHHTTDCMVYVTTALPHDFLDLVAEKVKDGLVVARKQRVINESLNYSCYMIKSAPEQAGDIAAIEVKVKSEYVAWLKSEHVRYQDLLRDQLKQAAAEKELKAQLEKEQKLHDTIEREVLACYQPLVIPE